MLNGSVIKKKKTFHFEAIISLLNSDGSARKTRKTSLLEKAPDGRGFYAVSAVKKKKIEFTYFKFQPKNNL